MLIAEAYGHVIGGYKGDAGRFYAPGDRLSLGKGSLYRDGVFAVFDPDKRLYRTAQGIVYVLTHECDVDGDNQRLFNADILVCPLTSLDDVILMLAEAGMKQEQMVSFLTNLGARRISRLIYVPPIPDIFPHGAVMYLNQVTNATVEAFKANAEHICAVTAFGLREIEYALENHMLRPKAERLALMPDMGDVAA